MSVGMRACEQECMHVGQNECMHVCVYACVCVCVCVCMYICMHACMYVCRCVYMYLRINYSQFLCSFQLHIYFVLCITVHRKARKLQNNFRNEQQITSVTENKEIEIKYVCSECVYITTYNGYK
jgi:hypothetical protein